MQNSKIFKVGIAINSLPILLAFFLHRDAQGDEKLVFAWGLFLLGISVLLYRILLTERIKTSAKSVRISVLYLPSIIHLLLVLTAVILRIETVHSVTDVLTLLVYYPHCMLNLFLAIIYTKRI